MPKYDWGTVAKLAESLTYHGVPPQKIEEILAGGELIYKSSKPLAKSDFVGGAMRRMGRLLDRESCRTIREASACCLGGKRLEESRRIAKENATLEERIAAANDTKLVFGHSVVLQPDGTILVSFSPPGLDYYRCACLAKPSQPIPLTYCDCCGGHVKHHLQIALGRKLTCRALTSSLSSGGSLPCTFQLSLVQLGAAVSA